ncbi:hypothetical protein CONLIGDRAFT_679487 [Coniochaeta ligniaria NRRL 30616]|uniref:SMP domain-containing protein n=1 Tax=Coniochaeta ligniaria NRRL 30616 TaxID=1408157 RepID=A0A1J7JBP4_9PEZI|nr:hypothetical protein CONLIGDRAFT_679487 [Coniochaeta ligniaria NRRL 30616]
MTLPTKDELHTKAVSGEEITEGLVNELTKDEAPEGGNPPAGGVAAMAQSIHDKQVHFKAVASEITSKPEAELTKADASKLMSAESRAKDGIRPPKDSTSAHVQSVADHNVQKLAQTKLD